MLYLLGSIILTSYLTISFKILKLLHINSFQAIVFNYITCVVTGSIVNGAFPVNGSLPEVPWFFWAVLMGSTFISLFNLVALTTKQNGVAVATVAYKLSLVIPFIFSIYFYRESVSLFQQAGIIIAMAAVILTCYAKRSSSEITKAYTPNYLFYLLPLIVFIGSGLQDTMIKYVEQSYLNATSYNAFLITAFATAASLGVLVLVVLLITGRQRFSYKPILAGIAIGIPNYFSIWCLLKVLRENTGRSSAIIPVNNMGIVLFSALVAWLAFKERLTLINWLGIGLSIISIALIAYT